MHISKAFTLRTPNQVGTLEYMAPEVLQKAGTSAAADVYAWAVTVNELATGTFPFADCTKDNPQCQTILNFGYGRRALLLCAHAAACMRRRSQPDLGGCRACRTFQGHSTAGAARLCILLASCESRSTIGSHIMCGGRWLQYLKPCFACALPWPQAGAGGGSGSRGPAAYPGARHAA